VRHGCQCRTSRAGCGAPAPGSCNGTGFGLGFPLARAVAEHAEHNLTHAGVPLSFRGDPWPIEALRGFCWRRGTGPIRHCEASHRTGGRDGATAAPAFRPGRSGPPVWPGRARTGALSPASPAQRPAVRPPELPRCSGGPGAWRRRPGAPGPNTSCWSTASPLPWKASSWPGLATGMLSEAPRPPSEIELRPLLATLKAASGDGRICGNGSSRTALSMPYSIQAQPARCPGADPRCVLPAGGGGLHPRPPGPAAAGGAALLGRRSQLEPGQGRAADPQRRPPPPLGGVAAGPAGLGAVLGRRWAAALPRPAHGSGW
jgi:hypothetical protein